MRGTGDRVFRETIAGHEIARYKIYLLAWCRDADSGRMKCFEKSQVWNRIAHIPLRFVHDEIVSLGSRGSAFKHEGRRRTQSIPQSFGNCLTQLHRQRWKIHRQAVPFFCHLEWSTTSAKTNRACSGPEVMHDHKCGCQGGVPAELNFCLRRKPTQWVCVILWMIEYEKGGLGEIVFRSDGQQTLVLQPVSQGANCGRIS